MKKLILLLLLITSFSLFSQTKLPKQQFEIIAGRSTHGTGDLRGLIFISEYSKYFTKKLSWTAALGGTIHDGSLPLFFNDPGSQSIDGSIRYTTAGVQTAGYLGYSFIRTNRHEVQVRAGALLRYQSSSYYNEVSVLYPLATGLAIPVNYFVNTTPQRTFAFGGSSELLYSYTFKKEISLGVLAGLQTDTNGDTITQTALTIGKRF